MQKKLGESYLDLIEKIKVLAPQKLEYIYY